MVPGRPSKDFVAITLDIPPAVFTVLGAWPEILALRPQFVQFLPGFDMAKFDKMPTYALALMRANTEYKTATETPASLTTLANSAIETRRVLLADLNSLIARGLIAASVLDSLLGVNGYKNVVVDIVTMADILTEVHPRPEAQHRTYPTSTLWASAGIAGSAGTSDDLRD